MKRSLAIAGMAALPFAVACGEAAEPIERQAVVAGFDWQETATVSGQFWHEYTAEEHRPDINRETIRDLITYDVEVCVQKENRREYNYDTNTYEYVDEPDDFGCSFDGDCFWGGTDEHCEEEDEPRYDYERLEWDVVAVCTPRDFRSEVKAQEPRQNNGCVASAFQNGYRIDRSEAKIVYARYEVEAEEEGEAPERRIGQVVVDSQLWTQLELGEPVTIYERDGHISRLELAGQ